MQIRALPLSALVAALTIACGGDDSINDSKDADAPVESGGAAGTQNGLPMSGGSGNPSVAGGAQASEAGRALPPDSGPAAHDSGAREGGREVESGSGSVDPGTMGDGNFTIAAPFHAAPELTVKQDVPKGTLDNFNLSSTLSAIYPVEHTNQMPFGRNVSVYVPKQYVAGTAAPFIVVEDGISFYRTTMVPVLDNMISERRLPVMIAIFVEPGPNGPTPEGERSFEYDTVSDAYVRFVEAELLPKIEKDYGLSLTTDPEGRAAMGGSSGGAAAFTMGWFRPDLYHRILTYSGSFCDLQPTANYPLGAWEYHDSLIANNPAKPLRVALEVGENDGNWNTSTDMHRDWRTANRAMAAALAARGYHYRFVYALGAGHVDSGVLQQTLAETLAWLWEGYPIP